MSRQESFNVFWVGSMEKVVLNGYPLLSNELCIGGGLGEVSSFPGEDISGTGWGLPNPVPWPAWPQLWQGEDQGVWQGWMCPVWV